MKKSLKVYLVLFVSLFFIIVANAGKEEQKVNDRFPFWDLPDELQDNIWEKVGNDIPPITKNLLLKSYCKKISNQEGNFDPTKAKIIASPKTIPKSLRKSTSRVLTSALLANNSAVSISGVDIFQIFCYTILIVFIIIAQ